MNRRHLLHLKMSALLISGLILAAGLAGCSSSSSSSTTGPQTTNQVALTDQDQFAPREIMVAAGTTVTWTNTGSLSHTVTADSTNLVTGGPSSDQTFPNGISGGQSYSWTVPGNAASGTKWYYHCRFHGSDGNGQSLGSGMSGSITVM